MEDRDLVNDLMSTAVRAEKKLSTELGDYVGRWVAVQNHEIVADADTLAALLDKIDPDSVEAVFQVVEQGTASFF